jgi:hypothetical protein
MPAKQAMEYIQHDGHYLLSSGVYFALGWPLSGKQAIEYIAYDHYLLPSGIYFGKAGQSLVNRPWNI